MSCEFKGFRSIAWIDRSRSTAVVDPFTRPGELVLSDPCLVKRGAMPDGKNRPARTDCRFGAVVPLPRSTGLTPGSHTENQWPTTQ